MLWTYNSLAIEGNRLSYGDTIFYLQNGLSVAGKPVNDFLETDGHFQAINLMRDNVCGSKPFSKHFACATNQLLTGHVKFIPAVDPQGNRLQVRYTAGSYRTGPTHVLTKSGTVHRYVEPHQIEDEMARLIDYVNSQDTAVHPIAKAAIAHYNFVRIHPFQDGNGRGARLLMNLVLAKTGLYPAVVHVDEKEAYFDALRAADKGDIAKFVRFIAASMDRTMDIVLETIRSELMCATLGE